MACIGFGIILAAFGTRAAGTWRSWSVVGCGAIAIVLFLILKAYPSTPPFLYGHLRNTENMPEVNVEAQSFLLVGRAGPGSHWQFFARPESLTGDNISITAKLPKGELQETIYIGCVPISILKERIGNSNGIDLTLARDPNDPSKQQWVPARTSKKESLGVFGNPGCPVAAEQGSAQFASLGRHAADFFMSSAEAASPLDIASIYAGLNSESLSNQRQAQNNITRLRDAGQIQRVVKSWIPAVRTDRIDAALVVAWVAGIRQDRAVAVPVASGFSREQLNYLVTLSGNRDRTTRYNAAELLSWLLQSTAWPNPPASEKVAEILGATLEPFVNPEVFNRGLTDNNLKTDAGNISFNTLVALQDAKCDMREDDRERVISVLTRYEASDFVRDTRLLRTVEMSRRFREKHCA